MDFIILCTKVILKMILNIAPGIVIIFSCIAITTEVVQDKTWLRKKINKYIVGVK